MHEMSLVRNIVEVVLDQCEGKGVKEVKSVNLVVGQLRDLLDAYVPDLFRYLARDTIAANAEVKITRIPLNVMCKECGNIFPIQIRDNSTWYCPRCNAYQKYRVFSGNEFYIESIEVSSDGAIDDDTLVSVSTGEAAETPAAAE